MKRTALLLLSVTTLILPVLAQGRGDAGVTGGMSGAPFTIGVLRRDGYVMPFAAFDGRRWQAPWPADLSTKELPISIQSIDPEWWGRGASPPKSMTLWNDGKPRGELQLMAPAFVPLRCGKRLGLRTNYYPAEVPPPPLEQPFPKDGIVVSGPQKVDVIESVAAASPERQAVAVAVAEEFDKEENLAASDFTNWRHPMRRQDRRKIPIEIEALYRAPMDQPGWTAHYVEAARRYPATGDDDCGLLTTARGWLRTGPKGQREVELGAQITYCDRYGLTFMLPLGLFKLNSGSYWVYQVAGYESESYLISKPTPRQNERVLAYPAVICPFPRF
jgi:hypothetical protein